MSALIPRDRLHLALQHKEPDRIPFDLASTQVTGISRIAYTRLCNHLGMGTQEPKIMDVMQQVVIPDEEILKYLKVDTRGIYPLVSSNWNLSPRGEGEYWVLEDEWNCKQRMPKEGGYYYSLFESPLDDATLTQQAIDDLPWPKADDPRRWAGLRENAEKLHAAIGKFGK